MKNVLFKQILVFSIALLFVNAVVIPLISGEKDPINTEPIIINMNQYDDIIEISYEINEFEEIPVNINDIEYSKIFIGKESNLLLTGKPDIPNICRSILISDTEKMDINVIDCKFIEYEDVLIAPSKGNLPRSVNPDEVPYEFDEIYYEDAWFPDDIASLREPYILRDFRGQVVEIYPIQYNPVKKLMRFYTSIEVEIYPDGEDTINCIYRDELPYSVDSDFKSIYVNHFINFGKSGRYEPVEEQGNMLIITYDDFWDSMIPFFHWKNMKGVPTEMKNVSEIGDANAIKTYLEEYYNEYGLTFVLLVGDAAQVPTLFISTTASDPSYSYIVGNDNYPDLFIGRFSAQNTEDLETQVERSIEYERYPQSGAEWYQKGTGVASSQGPGDDGELDYEHIRNIRTKLMDYTYTKVDELYDGSQGGEDEPDNPTPSMVSEAINDGRSVTNYCGHGSPTSWGSSGFSTTDINTLTNDNMLPYVVNVACNNGQFDDYDECFCEAWLRATHEGEPVGAIAATGSTTGMSWDPPMDAQDEMADLLVESYTDNVKHTIGGIHANGCMHMNDEYGVYGYSETDTWHVFGDPSLQVRTDTPSNMTVEHKYFILIGAETFELNVSGVENALCAISYETELLGCSYTDETGHSVITFNEPIEFMENTADLVITAYNKKPYFARLQIGTSYPPKIPVIDGPEFGRINKEYEYTTVTTDPEGDQILYMVDWGDGTITDWIGPVNSGEPFYQSHSWSEIGSYDVRVRAKDVEEAINKWSDPYTVQMDIPDLKIGAVKGGLFHIEATVTNDGIAEADEIDMEISLEGGIILFGKVSNGTITNIPAEGKETLTSKLIFGFGQIRVKVTVSGPECYAESDRGGKVFLFFVHVNPGGS